jgi:hypothetical protein
MFLCFLSFVPCACRSERGEETPREGLSYPTPDSDLHVGAEREKTSAARQAQSPLRGASENLQATRLPLHLPPGAVSSVGTCAQSKPNFSSVDKRVDKSPASYRRISGRCFCSFAARLASQDRASIGDGCGMTADSALMASTNPARLRCGTERDRDAGPQGRFQSMVSVTM